MTDDFKRWSDDELNDFLSQAHEEFARRHPPRQDAISGSVCVTRSEIERQSLRQMRGLLRCKCDQLYLALEDLIEDEYRRLERIDD